jgi:hypothetical protein
MNRKFALYSSDGRKVAMTVDMMDNFSVVWTVLYKVVSWDALRGHRKALHEVAKTANK